MPVTVVGLSSLTSISAGGRHTCAETADGQVFCWGDDQYGQLGTGTFGLVEVVPTFVTTAAAPRLGDSHGCAMAAGRVQCWGDHRTGQLGIGAGPALAAVPTDVVGWPSP